MPGAIVLRKPPSILHYLLGGLGSGITQGVGDVLRERERKKEMVGSVMDDFISGRSDPRIAATEEFEAMVQSQGTYEHPAIQKVMQLGKTAFGKPEIGPPQQRSMVDFRAAVLEERRALEEEKVLRRLKERELTHKLDRLLVEQEREDFDPGDMMNRINDIMNVAEEQGIDLNSLSIDTPWGRMSVVGAYQKAQDEVAAQEKREAKAERIDEKFYRMDKEIVEDRGQAIRAMARFAEAGDISLLEQIIISRGWKEGKKVIKVAKTLPRDKAIRMMVKAYNDTHRFKVGERNKLGRDPALKKRPISHSLLNPEAFIKGNVKEIYSIKEPVEKPSKSEFRDKIFVPPGEPSEEKIQSAITDVYDVFIQKQKQDPNWTKLDHVNYLRQNVSTFMQFYKLTSSEFEAMVKRIEEGKD